MSKTRATVIVGLMTALTLIGTGCYPIFGATEAQLKALRYCESTDRYDAVSKSGKFRGAYQFDRRTWESVGGKGDPAAAEPAEQDYRARLLHQSRGWRPWPHCGKKAATR